MIDGSSPAKHTPRSVVLLAGENYHCTHIHQLARLREPPMNLDIDDSVGWIIDHSADLGPRLLAQSIWSMIRLGIPSAQVLALPIADRLAHMSPQSFASTVSLLHRVAAPDNEVWDTVVDQLSACHSEFPPVELVNCCLSVAKSGRDSTLLFRSLAATVIPQIPSWDSRQITLLIHSMASANCSNWPLQRACIDVLTHRLEQAPSRVNWIDVACAVGALSKSDWVGEDDFLSAVSRWASECMHTSSAVPVHTLATLLHGIARLSSIDDRLMTTRRGTTDIFPPDLNWLNPQVISSIVDRVILRLPTVKNPNDRIRVMAMTAWSLSSLGVEYEPWTQCVASTVPTLIANLPSALADIVTVLSSTALSGDSGIAPVASAVVDHMAQHELDSDLFAPIHALWSLALVHDGPVSDSEVHLMNRLIARISQRADAAMLYHYLLLRGGTIEYPFGLESWRLMNSQWRGKTGSRAEDCICEWLVPLGEVVREREVLPGISADISYTTKTGERVIVEVNGPSHYLFDLAMPGSMRLKSTAIARNRMMETATGIPVKTISFLDFNILEGLNESDRDVQLHALLGLHNYSP